MKNIIAAAALGGALFAGSLGLASPAQAEPSLDAMTSWACQRLDGQPTEVSMVNVVSTLSMKTRRDIRQLFVRDVVARCPWHRAVIYDYFGL
jgi:hypothetical protein